MTQVYICSLCASLTEFLLFTYGLNKYTGTKELTRGTQELTHGTKELTRGTKELTHGTKELTCDTKEITHGTKE